MTSTLVFAIAALAASAPPGAEAGARGRVVVTRGAALRATPEARGVPLGAVYPDQVLSLQARDGAWVLGARADGQSGWLERSRTRPAPPCHPRALGTYAAGRLACGWVLAARTDTWTTWDFPLATGPDRRWRRHGTDRLIGVIEQVAGAYAQAHPGRRLLVGDLSRPRGGPFGSRFGGVGHASHQLGLDVDVLLPRRDGREQPATRPGEVDLRLAREVIRRFGRAATSIMFVGCRRDYVTASRKAEQLCNGLHEDHVHVRLPLLPPTDAADRPADAPGLCSVPPRAPPFERRVREAISSRADLGFRHDRAYVIGLLHRDPRGLTPAEHRYVRLRGRVADAAGVVRTYMAEHAAAVDGGVSIEDSPGRPYVLVRVTRDAPVHQAVLERLFPYPDNLTVLQVPYTEHDLTALADRVLDDRTALARAGFHTVGGGPDIGTGHAEVDVITRRGDAPAYFERRYGPAVEVRVIARRLTRLTCTSPISSRASPDGRRLRITWTTGPARLVHIRVRETPHQVRIGILQRLSNGPVPRDPVTRHAVVRLHDPLDGRHVVGATSGRRLRAH